MVDVQTFIESFLILFLKSTSTAELSAFGLKECTILH